MIILNKKSLKKAKTLKEIEQGNDRIETEIIEGVDLTAIQAELEKQQLLITNQAIAINKDREEMDLIKAENESLKSELANTARAINTLTGAEVAE